MQKFLCIAKVGFDLKNNTKHIFLQLCIYLMALQHMQIQTTDPSMMEDPWEDKEHNMYTTHKTWHQKWHDTDRIAD